MLAPTVWGGFGGLASSAAWAGALRGHWWGGGLETCRTAGTELEGTVSSDLMLAEPELCQACCQSARERCFLLKGMAVSRGTAPTKADQEEEAEPGRSPAASPCEASAYGHLEVAGKSS